MNGFASRMRAYLPSAALLCLVLTGTAMADDAWGSWNWQFFDTPPAVLLAAANALPAPGEGSVVVLLDEATFTLDAEGRCTSRYRLTYRILTQAGVDDWDTISAGWSPWYQERPRLRARVVTPDGTGHMLSPETISVAPARQSSSDLYTDQRVVRAPLPAVTVGAVVEQEVVVTETSPFFDAGNLHRYYIGNGARTIASRVVIDAPATLPILYRTHLLPNLVKTRDEADGRVRLTFEAGRLEPPGETEPGIPGDLERWPTIAFTTGRSWAKVGARYGEIVDRQLATSDLTARVRESVGNATTRMEIARRLLASLTRDVRYTGIEFGSSTIVPKPPQETLRQKYGDCKDQAALLVGMLRSAGVPAQVALLRSGGGVEPDPELPGLDRFNHAIVYLPGSPPIWIDPTASSRPAGELPIPDQGRRALVTGGSYSSLLVTPEAPSGDNLQVETREFHLAEKGKARVIESSQMYGSIGSSFRGEYATTDRQAIRQTLEKYARTAYLADKLTAMEVSDPGKVDEPFTIRLEMEGAARGSTDDDEAVVAIFPSSLTERLPAELTGDGKDRGETRTHDYLLPEPYRYEMRYRIVPPPGFRARTVPEAKTVHLGPMTLSRSFTIGKDGVVSALLRFDTGRRRLSPEEFEAVKAALRDLKNEKSVLIRFEQVGRALLAAGKFTGALAEFRRLAALHPGEALHHLQIADTLLAMGLRDAALREADRAIALEPRSALAHRTAAWILQHDEIGRRLAKGIDRKRAVAEYRRAKELDPTDFVARGDLAILLEYGDDGERYGRHADLAGAIAEYRGIRTDLKRDDLDKNLLVCLYRAQRWQELEETARSLQGTDNGPLYLILAIAGEKGAPAALEEARRLIPDIASRRQALESVVSSLVTVRHYEEAAGLLEEAASGAPNTAALRRRVTILKGMRPFERLPLPEGEPTTVVKRMFLSLFVPESAPDTFLSLFARTIREEAEKDGADEDLRNLDAIMGNVMKGAGDPPREAVTDIAFSALQFRTEGNDAVGYRIDATSPALLGQEKMRVYVVKEAGRYRLVTGSDNLAPIGLVVLDRIASGDLAGARTWLDWAREEIPRTQDDDPLSGQPFLRIWGQTAPDTPERMQIAAACLLSRMGYEKAVPILQEGRDSAGGALATAIDIALTRAYAEEKRYPELLKISERLKKSYPDSAMAFMGYTYALRAMNRWDDVAAAARQRLTTMPKDPAALGMLALCAEQKGDIKRARELYQTIVDTGKGTAGEYNNLAWLDLFSPTVSPEALSIAEQAVALSGGRNESSLHTLAALYAEAGMLAEARETILKALEVSQNHEPRSRHWYVLGRIAEQYGETGAAMEAYRKVVPEDNEIPAISTYALAQKRLAHDGTLSTKSAFTRMHENRRRRARPISSCSQTREIPLVPGEKDRK